MKTNSKKWILGLSALAFAGCLTFACGTTINASADETQQPTITAQASDKMSYLGISIRYEQNTETDGIRFGTLINKVWYDTLVSENAGKTVTTATVVVPTAYLASEDYAGVMAAADDDKVVQDTTSLMNDYNLDKDGVNYQPTVYLKGVPTANYNTEFTVLSYVAIDGEVAYYTAGKPLQHSVASAAKWLVENTQNYNPALDDFLLKYAVTYYAEDGTTVLQTENVKYGETTTYKGETPTKKGDMQTSYFFTGFGDGKEVTGTTKYTANYATYKNMDNYYYCVNEKFTLPTVTIDGQNLTYKFNGETITAGQEREMPNAGKYVYEITVGELGTISTEVTVMSAEDYEKNYLKTNTNQFYTEVGDKNGKLHIEAKNNTLSIENDGSYKYTANVGSAWDDRIEIGTNFVGGVDKDWDVADYTTFSFGIKLAQGTTLESPKYVVQTNAYSIGSWEWKFQFVDAQGNLVKSTDMQAGVWYTAIADLSMATYNYLEAGKPKVNYLYLYLLYNQKGTIYFKDMQFDGVENSELYNQVYFANGGSHKYMQSTTETIDGVQATYHYKKTNSGDTWGTHADFVVNAGFASTYKAFAFKMYIVSEADKTVGTAMYINAGAMKVYDENGNEVAKADMQHKKWYTIVTTATLGSDTMRFYTIHQANCEMYLTTVRGVKDYPVFQKINVEPTTKFVQNANGVYEYTQQEYSANGSGYSYRSGMTQTALNEFLAYKAMNTQGKTYALKMDITFLSGNSIDKDGQGNDVPNTFQFWYRNGAGTMLDVTFERAVTNGWMKMLDANGNEVTIFENNVTYTWVIYTTMDLGTNGSEYGLQIAMKKSGRTIRFTNARFE